MSAAAWEALEPTIVRGVVRMLAGLRELAVGLAHAMARPLATSASRASRLTSSTSDRCRVSSQTCGGSFAGPTTGAAHTNSSGNESRLICRPWG